jgi:hypothetical protein
MDGGGVNHGMQGARCRRIIERNPSPERPFEGGRADHKRRSTLRNLLAISALGAALAIAVPVGAQPSGMAAMEYYVGKWACVGGPTSSPPVKASVTYSVESGILRQWGEIPPQGEMKTTYAFNGAVSYDSKKHRYVSTFLDNDSGWELAVAQPWSGNTEHWTDLSTDSGKLARSEFVRTDHDNFTITSYEPRTATKPTFKVTCKRSS